MMKKYLKAISIILVLISSSYLPSVNAASSAEMLITIAETNPTLLERLNTVAIDNKELLNNVLKMAESKPEQVERLLNIAETDPTTFSQLVTINDATTKGIEDGGVIRT
jgi:hypothetical protein